MTMAIGYDKPLYVLPFDHRATFSKEMFGWQEPSSPEQTTEIAGVKQVIFDGLRAAVADGVPKDRVGVLVDEQFGAAILHDARKQAFITACPVEKSGDPDPSLRPTSGYPGARVPESLNSSTVRTMPATSNSSTRHSARCSCATIPAVTRP